MSLEAYLCEHFVDKPAFASLAGVSLPRLEQLLAAQAIPAATYVCNGTSISSAMFGATPIDEPLAGEYFRPECVRWARIADKAPPGFERAAVLSELTGELRIALRGQCSEEDSIQSKIDGYLPHFFNGTFALCVADPSTGAGIVRKEMLQERLMALTGNGTAPSFAAASNDELAALIDAYAYSSMPFSPAERERSSRKRLVDDLRMALAMANGSPRPMPLRGTA